ncbi:ABC transporter ATP-binding protein [Chloroflexota bacterium]
MTLLEVKKITKRFGGLTAINDLDLQVESGELAALIGPNGAGKSTFFNVISGVMRPTSGKVFFEGKDITGIKPHRIAEKGLVRTFQGTTLFSHLSVLKNVEIACHIAAKPNTIAAILGLPSSKQREEETRQFAADIVKLVGLDTVTEELARNLPHGYQRTLGVAIALATRPKLLCLDEPVTGMNVEEVQFMTELISKIRKEGTTVLLIEHTMRVVMGICDRITVINFGGKIAEGTPEEIKNNKDVLEAYLGGEEDAA